MEEDKGLMKIFKWAGLAALIAVPVIVFLKTRKDSAGDNSPRDESNIFASELEE